MANTTTDQNQIVTITGLDADWYNSVALSNPVERRQLFSIQFIPSAANDVMIIHDGSIDGPIVFKKTASGVSDSTPEYYPRGVRPNLVIDISDCTFGTAANAMVKIIYR